MEEAVVFWFRRDLRLSDQAGLSHALQSGYPVIPIFIFDPQILDPLPRADRRVSFIHHALSRLNEKLHEMQSALQTFHGQPSEIFEDLISRYAIKRVYVNQDYEPHAIRRDQQVKELLNARHVEFLAFKDQVIFEKAEVIKADGGPYQVFTPYSNAWLHKLQPEHLRPFPMHSENFHKTSPRPILSLEEIGFQHTESPDLNFSYHTELIRQYALVRDYPGLDQTSRIGIHFRFGTISIRSVVSAAQELNQTWLKELIWREFFMMILYHYPHVQNRAFKSVYDRIPWRNDESEFERWCSGTTGYPIVDAGMRQLNETGWMHNRVRMITAGFLCKHLLIDWRWGEAWFAEKLVDYELSSNNGNWQWAAGTGCDAAPYFRIFNPMTQAKKFDPEQSYIRRWLPELTTEIRSPIVDHEFARKRALQVYKDALQP